MPLEREVGPLQMQILGLLTEDVGLGVADVQQRLAASGHELAYTTVMTVLSRLYERGLVRREREGKRHVYQALKRAARSKTRILQRITVPALLAGAVLINAAFTFAGALVLALLAGRVAGSPRLAKWLLLSPA